MFRRSEFLSAIASAIAVPAAGGGTSQEATFPADVVRGDLDAIWSALVDVGAKPFATSDRAAVEATLARCRQGIAGPTTVRDAWLAIASVLGALNDGHVALGFPASLNGAPRAFPLRFGIADDGSLEIVADHTQTIPVGSKLVSVDDVPAARALEVFRAVLGGQTPALRRAKVRGSGAWPSVALFGFGPSYDVRYIDGAGAQHVVSLEATVSPPSTTHAPASAPYTYSTLREGSVGYIDYRSCEDLAGFKAFLGQTFASIQTGHVKALIIDVRKNGGGDSDLNDVLWTYVTTKPFKQFGGGIVKACERLKREYGHAKYVDVYGEDAWKAPDGTLITSGGDPNADLVEPGRQPLRFTGPTYRLTSALTFSSAMSCALAAKDYGLATIVGEETGEPVNSTGEVYSFVTPAIGFPAYLTTKYFFAPKPHPDGQGVVPDIPVETSTADVAAGRDPVIARVFAAIDGARL
jgi:hypothetical protein